MQKVTESVPEMQKNLERIVEELKKLKKKRREINSSYVPYVKNPLMGYESLFGTKSLRALSWSEEPWQDCYKKLFFEDIKYRSKLRKIRDKISALENEYKTVLKCIRDSVS